MKQREILFTLISIFILVLAWISFNLYHKSISSTINEPLKIQIQPINPNFNEKAVEILKSRTKINPSFKMIKQEEKIASPTPTINNLINNTSTTSGVKQ